MSAIAQKKRKRSAESQDNQPVRKQRPTVHVVNLDRGAAPIVLNAYEYRSGKPYGASAPAAARGHTPGHLVYYQMQGLGAPFTSVRFLIGGFTGSLVKSVYTDEADKKYTICLFTTKEGGNWLSKMLLKNLNSKPGIDQGTIDRLYLSRTQLIKVKVTSAVTKIENRDEEDPHLPVGVHDLVGARIQVIASLRFNTSPQGRTTMSFAARSIVILKLDKEGVAVKKEKADHDTLVSMAI